ncbi:MAG: vitamin K epoxide reductase family protein [bacterium]
MRAFIKKNILTIIAVLGILTTLVLTYLYYRANFLTNVGSSFCTVNSYINCDKVEKSSFSVLFGLPLSVYGLAFYMFVLFIEQILPKINFLKEFNNHKSYIFGASILAVLSSLYLGCVSLFQIHALCVLCSFTYLLNFMIFFLSKTNLGVIDHVRNCFNDMKKLFSTKHKIIFTITLTVIIASFITYANASGLFVKADKISSNNAKSLKLTRPVTIDVYTDYQCPYCQLAQFYFLQLEQNYPTIKINHHDFPLNKTCNKYIKESFHKNSCNAVMYAKAVQKQGKFKQYSTMLFLNQDHLEEKNLAKMAKDIGVDMNKLNVDIKSPQFKKEISVDVERAHKLGVTGTPTYFIGIHKYEGVESYQDLIQSIKEATN